VDVIGDAASDRYENALDAVIKDENVDGALYRYAMWMNRQVLAQFKLTHEPQKMADKGEEVILGMSRHPLFRKTGTDAEWALGGGAPNDHLFFRYWTHKEAVLKTSGAGFREFSQCRVRRAVDDNIGMCRKVISCFHLLTLEEKKPEEMNGSHHRFRLAFGYR